MDSILRVLLLRTALPVAAIAVAFAVAHVRGADVRTLFALRPPSARAALGWLLFWAAWVAAVEVAARALGVAAPAPWVGRGAALLAAIAVGMVLAAPALEELVFRGALVSRLQPRLGTAATVLATAALFSAVHVQYGLPELGLLFLDGVVLALARVRTGSVLLPFAMHAAGNLVAFVQRAAG
ncbi:CPBP family intramembrane glutamic endopeptidase [Anaeromyxobacter oryzae]|uniref:CAAX prenyl protease 2/Lysostaphin resistance protein A-like domain-containing protein n=1 Tax=Anaeromyxobacter oryzae TaxID=2918170 RepID=A0ABM7WT27_9BACT|nr:CPBP family intramembrane glutamic endopeptidase [Anaeromyxobacter oryzae]BDG02632.1 hypothetical protein AMOR_16280 [Anaeromyxobacter oryzae]